MSVYSSRELANVEGQCTAAGAPGWLLWPRKVSNSRRGREERADSGRERIGCRRKGGPYITDRWKNILKKEARG